MKNIFKRILLLTFILAVTFVLGACGKDVETDTYNNDQVEQDNNDQTNIEVDYETNEEENEEEIETSKTEYPITIEDSYNNVVTIEEEPNTIVSLGPNVTETLYALGAGDKVIGKTLYCDYPEEANDVETVGDLLNPNVEKIIELNPDLLIVSTHVDEEIVDTLKSHDINIISLYWDENFEGAYNLIEAIGEITNNNEKADFIINIMEESIEEVKEKVKDKEKPSAYFVTGYGEHGDFTATGDTFLGDIIKMAGAENAAEDGTQWAYSIEKLIEKDPDILIVSIGTKEIIEDLEGYKELTAVKEGRVYEVDENIFLRQGPRIAEGLQVLAKIFHPDVFEE